MITDQRELIPTQQSNFLAVVVSFATTLLTITFVSYFVAQIARALTYQFKSFPEIGWLPTSTRAELVRKYGYWAVQRAEAVVP